MQPGAIAFTVMPEGATSFASAFVKPITAAFAARAVDQAACDHILDNDLKILLGDLLSFRDVLERYVFTVVILCQIEHYS